MASRWPRSFVVFNSTPLEKYESTASTGKMRTQPSQPDLAQRFTTWLIRPAFYGIAAILSGCGSHPSTLVEDYRGFTPAPARKEL